MKVVRIVPNIPTPDVADARGFYGEILGLDVAMDIGWLATYQAEGRMNPQVSFAVQGGSQTPVPDLSIEVDDIDEALARFKAAGVPIVYGPANEP